MSIPLAPSGPATAGSDATIAHAAAHARFRATDRFGSLDGLRAAAILGVLWHHSPHPAGGLLRERGFLGVDLFFVISGFLITTLLLRERRRSGDISLRRFYLRRFLRIFPPYYATLAVAAALAFMSHGNAAPGIRHDLPFAFFYLSNLIPLASLLAITWSLSAEEQFYLVVPALEKYGGARLPVFLCGAYVLLSLPAFGLFPSWNLPPFFRQTTFGPILLGVLLAHLLEDPRGFGRLWPLLRHPLAPLIAAVLVVAILGLAPEDLSGWPRLSIHFALTALVASCVIQEEHALRRLLRLWPLRRIGIVSYGIYLYHMLVRHLVERGSHRLGWQSPTVFFVTLSLCSWLIAEISYRTFESRALALKNRFVA